MEKIVNKKLDLFAIKTMISKPLLDFWWLIKIWRNEYDNINILRRFTRTSTQVVGSSLSLAQPCPFHSPAGEDEDYEDVDVDVDIDVDVDVDVDVDQHGLAPSTRLQVLDNDHHEDEDNEDHEHFYGDKSDHQGLQQ